jgi:hypothetical protein
VAEDDLQSLGQILRQTRESRALTLDEVERQTRIRVKNLSILPSITHAKGFLRNYAQFLGLDVASMAGQFGELTGAGTAPVTSLTASSARAAAHISPSEILKPGSDEEGASIPIYLPSAPPPSDTEPAARSAYVTPRDRVGPAVPRRLAGPAPVPVPVPRRVMGPTGYPQTNTSEEPSPRRSLLPGRLLQSNLIVALVLLAGFALIIWVTSTQLSHLSIDSFVPTQEQSTVIGVFGLSATVPTAAQFPSTATIGTNPGPVILDRVVLTIRVTQRTWVRISVDGEVWLEGQATPGEILQPPDAQLEIIILAGNGAGLEVTYNGVDIGPLGERGEVVERFFTAGGQVLTPTPTLTVTPTATGVPTPTYRVSPTPGS